MRKANTNKPNCNAFSNAAPMVCLLLLSALLQSIVPVMAQDTNVLIGLASPAYGVKIKANFSGTGNWARGYSVVNQDNSQPLFGIGTFGSYTNGISQMTYGYIGPAFNTSFMYFLPNGNVGIGTNSPVSKLSVNGIIRAREVNVTIAATDWPDYVFNANYRLPDLQEVASKIKLTGHLPDMPSAEAISEQGLNVGSIIKVQQQKIEELTLYILELHEQLKAVHAEMQQFKSDIKPK